MLNFFDDFIEIEKRDAVNTPVIKEYQPTTEEQMKAVTNSNCDTDTPELVDNLNIKKYEDMVTALEKKVEELTNLINDKKGDDN